MKKISREELLNYWTNPTEPKNHPEGYFEPVERSQFLFRYVKKHVPHNAKILELGCNVGRNLHYLYTHGYYNLAGIEINEMAIQLLYENYPQMAHRIRIYHSSIEDVIAKFDKNQFDLVFTMAVLEHIHPDSEWIFAHIARITKSILITIEDEKSSSWRHYPRQYREIFEKLGFKQIEENTCIDAGLSDSFMLRIFRKTKKSNST